MLTQDMLANANSLSYNIVYDVSSSLTKLDISSDELTQYQSTIIIAT